METDSSFEKGFYSKVTEKGFYSKVTDYFSCRNIPELYDGHGPWVAERARYTPSCQCAQTGSNRWSTSGEVFGHQRKKNNTRMLRNKCLVINSWRFIVAWFEFWTKLCFKKLAEGLFFKNSKKRWIFSCFCQSTNHRKQAKSSVKCLLSSFFHHINRIIIHSRSHPIKIIQINDPFGKESVN